MAFNWFDFLKPSNDLVHGFLCHQSISGQFSSGKIPPPRLRISDLVRTRNIRGRFLGKSSLTARFSNQWPQPRPVADDVRSRNAE